MIATRKQLLVSGIIQLMIGSLYIIFGIVERFSPELHNELTITSVLFLAIWMGLWVGITGVLGILTKVKSSLPMIGVYMGFSITSIVFAFMIICYSTSIAIFNSYDQHRLSVMSILILVLSILEFGIGVWATFCCVLVFRSRQSQTGPLEGHSMAVPAKTSGPMVEQSGIPSHYNVGMQQQPSSTQDKNKVVP